MEILSRVQISNVTTITPCGAEISLCQLRRWSSASLFFADTPKDIYFDHVRKNGKLCISIARMRSFFVSDVNSFRYYKIDVEILSDADESILRTQLYAIGIGRDKFDRDLLQRRFVRYSRSHYEHMVKEDDYISFQWRDQHSTHIYTDEQIVKDVNEYIAMIKTELASGPFPSRLERKVSRSLLITEKDLY